MQRRRVLRGLAALAAGASAGCTGANQEVPVTAPDPPPGVKTASNDVSDEVEGGDGGFGDGPGNTPDRQRFVVPTRSFQQAEDGHLLVVVRVKNRTDTTHEAVLTVIIDAGSKTFTPSRFISLGPDESTEYRLHIPVPFDVFNQDPGFDAVFEPGGPETPIPDGTVTPYPADRATATAGQTTAAESTGTVTATATTGTTETDVSTATDRATDSE